MSDKIKKIKRHKIEGILPKGPYPPCLRMADRAFLAGYPRNIVTFSRDWDGTGTWKSTLWTTRIRVYYIVCIVATDDLMMQGARALAAVILTWFSQMLRALIQYKDDILPV